MSIERVSRFVRRNETNNSTIDPLSQAAIGSPAWAGGLTVSSVDLIAMIVSDTGLSAAEPQWWNASPLGCLLIAAQPRGGWQILQRAVQWGRIPGPTASGSGLIQM